MIKIVFIFLLALNLALLVSVRSFRARALVSKAAVNAMAFLLLGSTKHIDAGSVQTLAFLLIPTGILLSFLWLSLFEDGAA